MTAWPTVSQAVGYGAYRAARATLAPSVHNSGATRPSVVTIRFVHYCDDGRLEIDIDTSAWRPCCQSRIAARLNNRAREDQCIAFQSPSSNESRRCRLRDMATEKLMPLANGNHCGRARFSASVNFRSAAAFVQTPSMTDAKLPFLYTITARPGGRRPARHSRTSCRRFTDRLRMTTKTQSSQTDPKQAPTAAGRNVRSYTSYGRSLCERGVCSAVSSAR
jgi:hypothetical protein